MTLTLSHKCTESQTFVNDQNSHGLWSVPTLQVRYEDTDYGHGVMPHSFEAPPVPPKIQGDKKRELLKSPSKIEEIQKKKIIDRN